MIYKRGMRKLSDSTKIQAKSCPEIQDGLVAEAKRLKRKGLRWTNALGGGPLMNMLLAWFFALPESERERIAEEGKEALTRILERDYEDPENPAAPKLKPKSSKADGRGGSAKKLPDNRHSDKPVCKDAPSFLVS